MTGLTPGRHGPPPERDASVAPLLRAVSQWVVGVVLAVLLTLLFLAISAVQLSAEGTGQRLLRRHVAITTNIDAILPNIQAQLQEDARGGGAEQVPVPDFPILVELPREDALSLEGLDLRERILKDAGARLYEHGMSAWAPDDPAGEQDIEAISVAGALERGMGLITEENHDRILIAAIVLAVLSAAAAVLLMTSVRSWGRLIALSAVTIGAALPLLAAAVGVRFAFRTAEEEADPFVSGLLDLGVEAMWVPILNSLVLTLLGLAVMGMTLVLMWATSRLAARSLDTPAA